MSADPREPKSVPELIGDLTKEASELFRTEGRLIRSEISDKITQLQVGGGSIAAGGICLLVALIVLAQAMVVGLANVADMGIGWASFIIGIAFAAIGALLLLKGKKDLDPANLAPERTAQQLRKDTQLVKEKAR